MQIAKGINANDYLNLNLDLPGKNNDWIIAIGYLEKRLKERFLEPADLLIESENSIEPYEKKFGFAVLALDCLLLETIQSFYEGVTDSIGKSQKIFVSFLRTRDEFRNYFTSDNDAIKFYKNFRCGILHQAQTTGETRVWSVGELIQFRDDAIIVNRNAFHEAVRTELTKYVELLKVSTDLALLKNFKKKMDFIAKG